MSDHPTPTPLTGDEARTLLARVESAAEDEGVRVAAALVDVTGRLVALQVMAGTLLSSDRVAIGKAFAAACFGEPTRALGERIPAETRAALTAADGRPCFITGGVPVMRDGACVGGLGISGGPAAVDEQVAERALAAVLDATKEVRS